jgi:hypothetical protein
MERPCEHESLWVARGLNSAAACITTLASSASRLVADGLHDPAPVLLNFRIDDVESKPSQSVERAVLIPSNQVACSRRYLQLVGGNPAQGQ